MTVELTYEKFSELRGLYSKMQQLMKKRRRYYDLDFEREVIPGGRTSGIKAVIPRTARRAIDEAVDHVLTRPKVHVPVRPTESGFVTQQEIAEKKRKFVMAWWRQMQQRYNVIGDARKWLFLDGMVAVRHSIKWESIPAADDPKYAQKLKRIGRSVFPWEDRVLNNEWVFVDPDDPRNPEYAYVCYSLTVEAARRKFPNQKTAEWAKRPDYSKVTYLEGWSAPTFLDDGDWEPGIFRQWIDTDMVTDEDSPYPYVPIAVEDSGYGLVHEGIEVEDRFVGLLDHSFSTLVAQARQWTSMERVAELTAFNPIITRNIGADKAKTLRAEPGALWNLEGAEDDPQREQIELAKYPDIPIVVPQVIGLVDREVNGALKMDMLGGIPQTGVDTATEADQNVRNASAKLSGPVGALERLSAKLTRWALMDVELVLEAPVTLFGSGADDPADITLTPRDISGYYDVFVELTTTDEDALALTRARFWSEMYRVVPFLSAWTAMERGGIADDPLAEMLRRAGEDVFLSPEFTAIRVATGAESFGELAQMIAALTAKNGGPEGDIPGGGANSADGLITQDNIGAPVVPSATSDALGDRNLDQAASMLRAGRVMGSDNPNG